jgi:hypothetical protein
LVIIYSVSQLLKSEISRVDVTLTQRPAAKAIKWVCNTHVDSKCAAVVRVYELFFIIFENRGTVYGMINVQGFGEDDSNGSGRLGRG